MAACRRVLWFGCQFALPTYIYVTPRESCGTLDDWEYNFLYNLVAPLHRVNDEGSVESVITAGSAPKVRFPVSRGPAKLAPGDCF